MAVKLGIRDTIRIYARNQVFSGNMKVSLKTDGSIEADVATLFSMLGNRFKKDNVFGFDNESKDFITLKFADTSKSFVLKFSSIDDDENKMAPFLVEIIKANDPMDEPLYTYLINTDKAFFECKAGSGEFTVNCSQKGKILRQDIQEGIGLKNSLLGDINPLSDNQVSDLMNFRQRFTESLDKQIKELGEQIENLSKEADAAEKKLSKLEEQGAELSRKIELIHADINEIKGIADSKEDADACFDRRIAAIDAEVAVPEKKREKIYTGCREQIEIIQKGILYNLKYLSSDEGKTQKEFYEKQNAEYDEKFDEYKEYLNMLKKIETDKKNICRKQEG